MYNTVQYSAANPQARLLESGLRSERQTLNIMPEGNLIVMMKDEITQGIRRALMIIL